MSTPGKAALEGRRILELADETGMYCGKLLADLGAEVTKIEVPGGDATRWIPPFWGDEPHPERSLRFLYMNTNKRSVELDLARPGDRDHFAQLAARSDLVLETLPPGELARLGLGYLALSEANPGLVLTSITGFGQTGPHRDYKSSDLVATAAGGASYVIGAEEDPPVRLAGSQAHIIASTCAATASMIALHHSGRSGRGQHVDISIQETVVAASHIAGAGKWLEDGIIPKRIGTGLVASVPSGAYPCKDGMVYLMVNRPAHWKALAEWIHEVTGNQEVLDPMFDGPSSTRLPYRELLDLFISEMTSRLSVAEVYHEGQRRHIAFTPASTAAQIARDQHLREREFFVDVEHTGKGTLRYPGPPYRHAETPWRIARPAPRPGEHTTEVLSSLSEPDPRPARAVAREVPPRALEGLRIVEFGTGMAGPWVGRLMAWCGAEVIKVESRDHPDVPRLFIPPRNPELGIQPQLSPWFTDWNGGKRFISLDLTKPDAVDLVKRLVGMSDVLVENFSTGVLAKLGLGYAELKRINPRLVLLSSSGYGDSGPNCHYVTWGPNIEALAGMSTFSGFPERDCTMTHFAYPDPLSALHGLFAVMSALDHRERTDQGQYINMAQFETTICAIGHVLMEYLANGREPQRLGNASLHRAPHSCYPCRGEDRWCAIAVSTDEEWRSFCEVLGEPGWIDDPRFATLEGRLRHAATLDQRIQEWTSARDPYDVMHALQRAGIAASVVQTTEDQFERDPHLAARGFFEEIQHLVKGPVHATGIPLGLTGTPGHTPHAGEAIGQDNDYVFRELLGLSPQQIQHFTEIGAIES